MSFRIKKCLNSTEKEIRNKKYNIFLGISLGNKYFTKENLREYLLWALKNTKEKVAILIVDKIHAINYEIRRGYSKDRALSVALRHGEETRKMVREIINTLSKEMQNKIEVVKWQVVEQNTAYKKSEKIIKDAFQKNTDFHDAIIEVVKENVDPNIVNIKEQDYEKLANYIISELPVLISGFKFQGIIFNLSPYPGFCKVDNLVIEIQKGKKFSNISEDLGIINKRVIVEAYVK